MCGEALLRARETVASKAESACFPAAVGRLRDGGNTGSVVHTFNPNSLEAEPRLYSEMLRRVEEIRKCLGSFQLEITILFVES